MKVPAQINETFILSYDNFDTGKFESLPDFIKTKMRSSLEFAALFTQSTAQTIKGHEDGLTAPVRSISGDVIHADAIDDLPF